MEDIVAIKSLLGLTQEEMTTLLGLKDGRWSMFKSGKRGLPPKAQEQLVALLQAAQKNTISKETQQFLKQEQAKSREKLKRDLQGVQIKLLRTEKKIVILENHRSECLAALKMAAFLEKQNREEELAKEIKSRAIKTLDRHNLHKLEQLLLQKEMFEMLKLKIEKKLNL